MLKEVTNTFEPKEKPIFKFSIKRVGKLDKKDFTEQELKDYFELCRHALKRFEKGILTNIKAK